jgi:hypothetical protein
VQRTDSGSRPVIRWPAVPGVLPALTGSAPDGVFIAVLALVALLGVLGVAVHVAERSPQRAGGGSSVRPPAPPSARRPAQHRHLSAGDLSRLSAFRARARLLEGEPLHAPGWAAQLRRAWRQGYSGWIVACLAGAFSMATHFGVWWLAAGGGWPGAVLITFVSTAVMVSACAWIGLGLIAGR